MSYEGQLHLSKRIQNKAGVVVNFCVHTWKPEKYARSVPQSTLTFLGKALSLNLKLPTLARKPLCVSCPRFLCTWLLFCLDRLSLCSPDQPGILISLCLQNAGNKVTCGPAVALSVVARDQTQVPRFADLNYLLTHLLLF